MTELTELLEAAAPPVAPLDISAVEARVRQRRNRRIALRSGLAMVMVGVVVAGAIVLRAGSAPRQVDVEGGHHPTPSSTPLTTIPSTAPPTTTGGPAPTLPKAGDVVASRWLEGTDMLTPQTGIGVVSAGASCFPSCGPLVTRWPRALAITTDGGASWRVEGSTLPATADTNPSLVTLTFSSQSHGDVLAAGTVFVTADGGTHWAQLAAPGPVWSLSLAGGSLWAMSGACPAPNGLGPSPAGPCPPVLLTTSPGSTAASIGGALPDRSMSPTRIDAVSGLLARFGAPPALELTSDSGRSWQTLPSPCGSVSAEDGGPLIAAAGTRWWVLCELDAGMNQGTVDLYETTDGGSSWTSRAAADAQGGSRPGTLGDGIVDTLAASGDGRLLWATTIAGVEVSTDGGQRWSPVDAPIGDASLSAISTDDSSGAWLVALGSGLWRTTDGLTWHR